MKRHTFTFIGSLLAALPLIGCAKSSPTAPGHAPALSVTRFLAFGDSLTEGKLSDGSIPGIDYPRVMRSRLSERYPAQAVTVEGAGWGGECAADSLPRYRAALADHRPDAVVILHGVNDISGGAHQIGPAVSAIRAMVDIARADGAVVFVGTLPPFSEGYRAHGRAHVAAFNDALRATLSGSGAVLVDLGAGWDPAWMGDDGIHPTAEGYAAIGRAFSDAAARHLER